MIECGKVRNNNPLFKIILLQSNNTVLDFFDRKFDIS